jgi:hypothetical protein
MVELDAAGCFALFLAVIEIAKVVEYALHRTNIPKSHFFYRNLSNSADTATCCGFLVEVLLFSRLWIFLYRDNVAIIQVGIFIHAIEALCFIPAYLRNRPNLPTVSTVVAPIILFNPALFCYLYLPAGTYGLSQLAWPAGGVDPMGWYLLFLTVVEVPPLLQFLLRLSRVPDVHTFCKQLTDSMDSALLCAFTTATLLVTRLWVFFFRTNTQLINLVALIHLLELLSFVPAYFRNTKKMDFMATVSLLFVAANPFIIFFLTQ